MKLISDEKYEQIQHYFENICSDHLLICPNCGMPYVEGYLCNNCGSDNSEQEINCELEEWKF